MKRSQSLGQMMERMTALAARWVKAWPYGNGYTSVGDVKYCSHTSTISFQANPSCSGLGRRCSIPASYMDDSSTLEADSLKWYQDEQDKVKKHFDRLHELEQTPEVREYLQLKQHDPRDSFQCYNVGLLPSGPITFIC